MLVSAVERALEPSGGYDDILKWGTAAIIMPGIAA